MRCDGEEDSKYQDSFVCLMARVTVPSTLSDLTQKRLSLYVKGLF